jgi:hypothetical protein
MSVFLDMAPCSLTEVDQRFRVAYSLHNRAENTTHLDTTVYFYETTRRHIPVDCHLMLLHLLYPLYFPQRISQRNAFDFDRGLYILHGLHDEQKD